MLFRELLHEGGILQRLLRVEARSVFRHVLLRMERLDAGGEFGGFGRHRDAADPAEKVEQQLEHHGRIVAGEETVIVAFPILETREGVGARYLERLLKLTGQDDAANAAVGFAQRVDVLEAEVIEGGGAKN